MNFNQLKYIIAVDKNRNFAKAADECEVAQSTLSREIQRLEQEFNILIFDRSRYPVVPTMKGKDLLESAAQIIEEYHHFIEIAQKKDNQPSGHFNLGVLPGIAPYLLPLFSTKLSSKYPKLNLKISEIGEKGMEEGFVHETIDAALSIAPFFKEGFYEDFLFEEEFVLYLNEHHALAKKDKVNWEDIPTSELILQEGIRSFLIDHDVQKNDVLLPPKRLQKVAYENSSLETIRKIIDMNGGVTLLPHLSTLYMGERRLKMVKEINNPTPTRSIIMVTPRGFEKNRITKVIRKEIIAGLPKTEKIAPQK